MRNFKDAIAGVEEAKFRRLDDEKKTDTAPETASTEAAKPGQPRNPS